MLRSRREVKGRVGHRPPQRAYMVIRAFVLARLLGLRLLTLDACVVIDGDDGAGRVVPARLSAIGREISKYSQMPQPAASIPASGQRLAHAMQLLEQGIQTLEQSRRDRLAVPPN